MNITQEIVYTICEKLAIDHSLLESMIDAPKGAVATWIKTDRISTKFRPKITALLAFMATCKDMGIELEGDELTDILFETSVDTSVNANTSSVPVNRDKKDIVPGDKKISLLKYMMDCGEAVDMSLVRKLIEYNIFREFYAPRFEAGQFGLLN